jgi:sulfite reductase (ferredoxin)
LLKPLTELSNLKASDYIDWGDTGEFNTAVGTGECAGVIIDLVATLLYESEEKLGWAIETFENKSYADSIYHSYSVFVGTAKALLLTKDVSPTTQNGIINEFNNHFNNEPVFLFDEEFKEIVLQINKNEPSKEFAGKYLAQAKDFLEKVKAYRKNPSLAFQEAERIGFS